MKTANVPSVLACGAWLKNAACLFTSGQPQWSPLHGDLSHPEACRALEVSARTLLRQAPQPVTAVAHDLHPDFYSTRLAIELAHELGVPAIGVQHHHAHIAAVMAEHGVQGPVVGLALDGVGLGTDGTAWGGELLWVDQTAWRRLGHLWPLALPGGDVAAREPWRMAAAALHALGRTGEVGQRFTPVVGKTAAEMVQHMLERGINCPSTSSTGRWFDAAAGALGLSVRQTHEAEAAMALEQQAQAWLAQNGTPAQAHEVAEHNTEQLDLRPLLARLLETPAGDGGVPAAAAWFHLALADALADWAAQAAEQTGTRTVCLGGGCFANQLLTGRVTTGLQGRGLRVLLPQQHSCGDAGLALGQAWVVAHRAYTINSIAASAYSTGARGQFHPIHSPETESLPCA
ncbi:MAG: carbamoyltransferase HypF [Rhodoferax sp.]|uniref:Kae1-like domain-containing protein n=1 Tax=Rhodoferax sp. TaxID=50421 RepID=UPI00183BF787|nr:carbamoyltransferase HypF [Rhodoferax sp.]NMM12518.1 carbamoyltransferase HypF [Rhodoferax sp.]NMM21777.1 carbamoyltransferase HypF [Rhodoferax sp.]